MSETNLADPGNLDEMSPEQLAELLNEYQYKAQNIKDMPDEEVRAGIKVLSKIRQLTSAAAAKRTGKVVGPPPSLDDF